MTDDGVGEKKKQRRQRRLERNQKNSNERKTRDGVRVHRERHGAGGDVNVCLT